MRFALCVGTLVLVLVSIVVEGQRFQQQQRPVFNQQQNFNNRPARQNFNNNNNFRPQNNNNNFRPQNNNNNFRPQQQQNNFRPQQNFQQQNFRPQQQQNFRPQQQQQQNNFRPQPQQNFQQQAPQQQNNNVGNGSNRFSLVLDTSDGRFAPFNGPVKGIPAGHGGGKFGAADCLLCPNGS